MGKPTRGGFALVGTGAYLPADGPGGRPLATSAETSSAMAAAAARDALAAAAWSPASLDVLIGGCSVMEQPIPGTAILVQRRLGIGNSGIAAFDVNATCLSGLLAFDLATAGVASGRWRRALVVTADMPSAAIDREDATLAPIFGDGAAALLVGAGQSRVLASRFESHGAHADLCRLEAGGTRLDPYRDPVAFAAGTRFRMEGPALYRATARLFPAFIDRLLDAAGVGRGDVDLTVPHQASAPALAHLRSVMGGPADRVIDIFAERGNQVATSLPHALHVAATTGRLRPGQTILLVGSAAGITLGGMVIRW